MSKPVPVLSSKANFGNGFSSLTLIKSKVEGELSRSWIYRFLHQDSIASMINDCIHNLADAWHTFDVSKLHQKILPLKTGPFISSVTIQTTCLLILDNNVTALKRQVSSQAKYDDQRQVSMAWYLRSRNQF